MEGEKIYRGKKVDPLRRKNVKMNGWRGKGEKEFEIGRRENLNLKFKNKYGKRKCNKVVKSKF